MSSVSCVAKMAPALMVLASSSSAACLAGACLGSTSELRHRRYLSGCSCQGQQSRLSFQPSSHTDRQYNAASGATARATTRTGTQAGSKHTGLASAANLTPSLS